MKDLSQLLKSIDRMVSEVLMTPPGLPPQPGDIEILAHRTFPNGTGLDEAVQSFLSGEEPGGQEKPSGWILWSERLEIVREDWTWPSEAGWILAAELCLGTQSVRLWQEGTAWVVETTTRNEEVPIDPELELPAAFIEEVSFLPYPQLNLPEGLTCGYEVAWRLAGPAETRAFRPAAFRFAGFKDPNTLRK